MSKELVQARINGEIKTEAAAVLADMGLTVSDAVRMLLTTVARKKIMPLELFTPNEITLAAVEDARTGKVEPITINEIRAVIRASN